MKKTVVFICYALAGYIVCLIQNNLEETKARRYSEDYLCWSAPITLSQLFVMNDGLAKNNAEMVKGAIDELTIHTLIDCKRAIDLSGWRSKNLPKYHQLTMKIFEELRILAKKNNLKPIFNKDAKKPLDSKPWNPLRPPGFEIGKFWEQIEAGN